MEFLHRELVFWGVEVQSGKARQVKIRDNILHLSQACLCVSKKNEANERVVLFVETDKKKCVFGILSTENLPQQQFNLVFHTDFKLSHDWKNGSVFFYGYKTAFGHYLKIDSDESEPEEDYQLMILNIGKKNAYYLNSDDSEDENDEKTSQEAEPSNKRAAETATETRVQNKKANKAKRAKN